MFKLLELRPLPGYKLRLRYADGAEGDVDLSGFAGRGVFELWNDYSAFERVDVTEFGHIAWSDEVEMCGNALYLRLTGKKPASRFGRCGCCWTTSRPRSS